MDRRRYYWFYASQFLQRPVLGYQLDDWCFMDQQQNCCILRSRGGSKTTDGVDWLMNRVWCTQEKWGWLTPKSGQLAQASMYFQTHPLFKKFTEIENKRFIELQNGCMILFGIISTSTLGMRLDGIVIDEEEDMEPKQEKEIYPQMAGMLSVSKIHKRIHMGTRWIATTFDTNCDILPCSTHDWQACSFINAEFIQSEELVRPAWEIDLLYRCKRTVPGGLVFTNIVIEPKSALQCKNKNRVGIDINANEAVVEICREENHVYLLNEWEGDFVHDPSLFNRLISPGIHGELMVETEDGGYNSKEAELLTQQIGCSKQLWDNPTKSARMAMLRLSVIHMNRELTPNTCKDIESTPFDPKTGLYFKHPQQNPCHWLDALLHAVGAEGGSLDFVSHSSPKSANPYENMVYQ